VSRNGKEKGRETGGGKGRCAGRSEGRMRNRRRRKVLKTNFEHADRRRELEEVKIRRGERHGLKNLMDLDLQATLEEV